MTYYATDNIGLTSNVSAQSAVNKSSVADQWNMARLYPQYVPTLNFIRGAQNPENIHHIDHPTKTSHQYDGNRSSFGPYETWLNLEQSNMASQMGRFDVMARRCEEEITKSLKENGLKFMRGNSLLFGDEVHEQLLSEAYLPVIDKILHAIWTMGVVPISTQLVRVSASSDELQPIPVVPEFGTYDISFVSYQGRRVYRFYHRIDVFNETLPPQRHPNENKPGTGFLRRFDPLVTVYDRFGHSPLKTGDLTAPWVELMPIFKILNDLEMYLTKGVRGESEPLLVTEYDQSAMPASVKEKKEASYAGSKEKYQYGNDDDDDDYIYNQLERAAKKYDTIFSQTDLAATSGATNVSVQRAREDVALARARHVHLGVGRKLAHHIPAAQPKEFVQIRTQYEELVCTR
jgi:hypothetical protein